VGLDI